MGDGGRINMCVRAATGSPPAGFRHPCHIRCTSGKETHCPLQSDNTLLITFHPTLRMADTPDKPRYWLNKFRHELYGEVLPFWVKHSLDKENGGYFNCLHEDGTVFDFGKYVWLQGRQVWMLSKIYGEPDVSDVFLHQYAPGVLSRETLLKGALLGATFLQKYAVREEDGLVWFLLSKEGNPIQMQRKPWGACFYCMGLAELARVMPSGRAKEAAVFYRLAIDLFRIILSWFDAPWLLGSKYGPGQPATSSLAVPMILLNMCHEIKGMLGEPDENEATPLRELAGDEDVVIYSMCQGKELWCIDEIKKHIKYDQDGGIVKVLETVGVDGSELEGSGGRLVNPGHVIEAGWFLIQYSETIVRDEVRQMEIFELGRNITNWAYEIGWDSTYGGIFYFLDAGGFFSPMELEWDMKLWWPHSEALISFAMAYHVSGNKRIALVKKLEGEKEKLVQLTERVEEECTFLSRQETEEKMATLHAQTNEAKERWDGLQSSIDEMLNQEQELWSRFQIVATYVMEHFKDTERGGEWYGYLNRQGELTQRFKGGPYKGCFHVPRALWLVVGILEKLCQKELTEGS